MKQNKASLEKSNTDFIQLQMITQLYSFILHRQLSESQMICKLYNVLFILKEIKR